MDPDSEISITEFLASLQRQAMRMSINSLTLAQIAISALSPSVTNSIDTEIEMKSICFYTETNPEL